MSALSPLRFVQQVEKKPPPSCLLSGEETQLMEEARIAVAQHFGKEDRRTVDLDKPHSFDVLSINNNGLFGKNAELYQFFSTGKPATNALALIEEASARIEPPDCLMVVILEWDYKYKKAVWYKKLGEQLAHTVQCDRLPASDAAAWVSRWAKQEQVPLDDNARDFISIHTEGNLFAAKQAIAKLALSGAGGGGAPDEAALRAALADGARYDIMDLSNAIYDGNPARALTVLRQLRADNIAEVLIQWSVVNVLNNIAAAKSGGRVLAWGKQLNAVHALAKKINDTLLYRLTQQAALADRANKGVANGDGADILSGIVTRLAVRQKGDKITLPVTPS